MMEWKLIDKDGVFLQEVNCQYDACDLATMMYDASVIEINFHNKTATIKEVSHHGS